MRSLVVLPLLLAATPALAQSNVYRAAGNGPNWTLAVGSGSIIYRENGRARVITPSPVSRPSANGERLVTPRISIDISHSSCSLRGNGARFRDTVRVTTARGTVVGCGGGMIGGNYVARVSRGYAPRPYPMQSAPAPRPMPEGSGAYGIDRSSWTIIAVDGDPISTARATSIRFHDRRVEGNAGCNSFGSDYTVDRGVLTAHRIISTRMACGSGSHVERALYATLEGGAEIDEQGRNRLVLEGRDHQVTLGRVNDPDRAYRDDNGYAPGDDLQTLPNGYARGCWGDGSRGDEGMAYREDDDRSYRDDRGYDDRRTRNDDDRYQDDDRYSRDDRYEDDGKER